MWRVLSRRRALFLGLFHITSLLIAPSTSAAVGGGRDRKPRRGAEKVDPKEMRSAVDGLIKRDGDAPVTCRCAADQWEGVVLSVDREFHFGRQDVAQRPPQHLSSAESASKAVVHYDFSNGLFASNNLNTGVRMIIDYNMGVQYIMNDGRCRVRPAPQVMNRMCMPENAQLVGKFRLMLDEHVAVWSAVGPYNSTLRTTVSLARCLPVSEETFSPEHDYGYVSSSMYFNMQLGIKDYKVFDVPAQCRRPLRRE